MFDFFQSNRVVSTEKSELCRHVSYLRFNIAFILRVLIKEMGSITAFSVLRAA